MRFTYTPHQRARLVAATGVGHPLDALVDAVAAGVHKRDVFSELLGLSGEGIATLTRDGIVSEQPLMPRAE